MGANGFLLFNTSFLVKHWSINPVLVRIRKKQEQVYQPIAYLLFNSTPKV